MPKKKSPFIENDDGDRFLQPTDLFALEKMLMKIHEVEVQRELEARNQEIRKLRFQVAALQFQIFDDKYKIDQKTSKDDMDGMKVRLKSLGTEYNGVKKRLAKKYDIDFDNLTYDDETGKITILK